LVQLQAIEVVPSRAVACRRVPSRAVACRRVPSRAVACRRVPSRAVPSTPPVDFIVSGLKNHCFLATFDCFSPQKTVVLLRVR
jgi:hypothetical protein